MIHLMLFLKGLFQLNEEKSCSLATSVYQGIRKCMLPKALGVSEGMSHRSVLALEVEGFYEGFLPPCSQSVLLK